MKPFGQDEPACNPGVLACRSQPQLISSDASFDAFGIGAVTALDACNNQLVLMNKHVDLLASGGGSGRRLGGCCLPPGGRLASLGQLQRTLEGADMASAWNSLTRRLSTHVRLMALLGIPLGIPASSGGLRDKV